MSVSGVRNSWLTLEKKAVFALSISASASARFLPSSLPRIPWPLRCLWRSGRRRGSESRYESSTGSRALTPAARKPARWCALLERMGTTSAVCGGSVQGPGGAEPPRRNGGPVTKTVPSSRIASASGHRVSLAPSASKKMIAGQALSPLSTPERPIPLTRGRSYWLRLIREDLVTPSSNALGDAFALIEPCSRQALAVALSRELLRAPAQREETSLAKT
jgi:hypothetical protein